MRRPPPFASVCALCLVAAASTAMVLSARQSPPPAPAPQPQPTFRTGVTMVPVDVRVLDREGKPVTDLKQSDFIVLEDGRPQEVSHFSAHGYVPMTVPPGAKPAIRTRETPAIQQQSARIFLIVLGRGRLQIVSKGLDAVIHMVRERLLPQDQVAVMAWNRATDFSTDHEKVVAVLERFKRRHEGIENALQFQLSGLAAVYGSRDIPPSLQRDIDEVFRGPGAIASRQITPEPITDAKGLAADDRRATDALQRAEIVADRPGAALDPFDRLDADRQGLPFEAYVSSSVQTMQDLGSLYTAIEYLRFLEGEKHVVFVTEQGMYLPRVENDSDLAARANNARVAIDTIQTGGLDSGPPPTASAPAPVLPSAAFTAMDSFRISTLKTISNLTGGQSAAREYAGPAVDRIDVATRFGYLLGYRPTNTVIDNRYRRIVVRVTRPGLMVLYRHGYFSNDGPPPTDRRKYLTTRRIAGAGYYAKDVTDIPVKVTRSVRTKTERRVEVTLDVTVDASRVSFATVDNRHVAVLDLAIFGGDSKERIVGQSWHKMDLKLKEETYQRYMREGIPFQVVLSAVAQPAYVKVVVYDYAADLVGSTNIKLK